MAFCPKCGAQVAPETQFCPYCGAPVSQPAAPQQPMYQQPHFGKETIDQLPNAENQYTTPLTWVGIAGAFLSVVLAFVDKVDGWEISKLWCMLSLLSAACSCAAMVNIFLSLKKGLMGRPVAMPSLLTTTAILNGAMTAFTILTALILLGASSLSDLRNVGSMSVLTVLAGLAYFVCFIIVAVKLLGAYEGALKTLALVFIAIPVIGILMAAVAVGNATLSNVNAMSIVFTIIMQGISVYLYYLAHQIFTGRNLI